MEMLGLRMTWGLILIFEHFRSVKSSFEELIIHMIHACTTDQELSLDVQAS